MKENKFYITTAIDYVNAKPHVGHAVEKLQADALARFHKNVLGEETYFLTGSDENALKNVQSAKKAGKNVSDFVEENAQAFKDLKKTLNLSFDQFIQTREEKHFKGAQKMWSSFKDEDKDKKAYKGLYCVGCEEFKKENDLVDGKCPDHGTEPEMIEEENYFFKLTNYAEKLEKLIESGELEIVPEFRKNEVLSFIRGGLEDFSISRSVQRAENWGVPVPGDESQIMYVWVDALSNYITALGYESDGDLYKKYWEGEGERVHVIGKGILRFHAVYWPAMLLSAGLPLPTKILCHEYLTINGKKISKSLGNVINPDEVREKFGVEGARYVLLSALPWSKDGDITWEGMTEKYNADLANGIGNLTSRIIKLYGSIDKKFEKQKNIDNRIESNIKERFDNMRLSAQLEMIMGIVHRANSFIEKSKPWELAKNDKKKYEEVMGELVQYLYFIADQLVPFLPETSDKIKKALQEKKVEPLFQRIKD